MMKKFLFAVSALALLVPATMSAADLASNADYKAKCAGCHGAAGEGKPAMKTAPLKDVAASQSVDQIAATITNGKPPKMPGYQGKLTPDQIKALAEAIKASK
jgi:mono/diheme cytochrome c family protein